MEAKNLMLVFFFVYVTKDVCHRVQLMKNRHQPVCFSQVALVDVLFQLLLVAMNNCWHFIWQFTMVLVKKNPL